jgi:hypothetical protein
MQIHKIWSWQRITTFIKTAGGITHRTTVLHHCHVIMIAWKTTLRLHNYSIHYIALLPPSSSCRSCIVLGCTLKLVTVGWCEVTEYKYWLINVSYSKNAYLPLFGLTFSVVLSLIPSSLGILSDICDPVNIKKSTFSKYYGLYIIQHTTINSCRKINPWRGNIIYCFTAVKSALNVYGSKL